MTAEKSSSPSDGNPVSRSEAATEIIDRMRAAVVQMDSDQAVAAAREVIEKGLDVADAVIHGLNGGMRLVADRYDRREVYLPQVLASANAFYAAFDLLRPYLYPEGQTPERSVIIGVVEGDIHDIGKNLVKVMIEAHGYTCLDLGKDVPTEEFLDRIEEVKPDYVAISTLMTPTLICMREVIEGMEERGLRDGLKVIVGGAQVSQEFADDVRADFYGKDERDAVAWLEKQEKGAID